jgi:hypothetical protein
MVTVLRAFLFFWFIIPFAVSSGETSLFTADSVMPVPGGQQIIQDSPLTSPILSSSPSLARTVGVGSAASGGDTLTIQIGLNGFSGPVDLFAAFSRSTDPETLYILNPDLSFQARSYSQIAQSVLSGYLPTGVMPWRSTVTGPLNETLFSKPVSTLPHGIYTLYFFATPAGNIQTYYLWVTTNLIIIEPDQFITYDIIPLTYNGVYYGGIKYSEEIGPHPAQKYYRVKRNSECNTQLQFQLAGNILNYVNANMLISDSDFGSNHDAMSDYVHMLDTYGYLNPQEVLYNSSAYWFYFYGNPASEVVDVNLPDRDDYYIHIVNEENETGYFNIKAYCW